MSGAIQDRASSTKTQSEEERGFIMDKKFLTTLGLAVAIVCIGGSAEATE